MSNQDEDKNARTQIVKPIMFNLSSKKLFRYPASVLLRGLKFTPTPKRNNIELKNLTHKITSADCDLLSFSKTKKQTIPRKIFFEKRTPLK